MIHRPDVHATFTYLPSVYMSANADRTLYNLYVTVTMPANKTLDLVHAKLEDVKGAVLYAVIDDPLGSNELHIFQQVIPFTIDNTDNLDQRQIAVTVINTEQDQENVEGIVIIHHADVDEEGPKSPRL